MFNGIQKSNLEMEENKKEKEKGNYFLLSIILSIVKCIQ